MIRSCLFLSCMAATWFGTSIVSAGIVTGSQRVGPNGHIYYLLTQNNWSNSEAEAVGLGGHLATVNDAAENAWIVSNYSGFGGVSRALWIGLNDVASEGNFVWSSGQPVVFTKWALGEPNNNLGAEDWAHIFPSTDSRYPGWNDAPDLSNAFGFVFNGVAEVEVVPEPGTVVLFVSGLGVVFLARRLRDAYRLNR
ncbi:MAG: lectin-like protein [Planctomycetaceae bacterium]